MVMLCFLFKNDKNKATVASTEKYYSLYITDRKVNRVGLNSYF